ncbi:putative SAM-dependent methyltransferase [Natronobacillus azotifigens]
MDKLDRIQSELKVVIGAGEYNNNPDWIQTQEHELHLLEENSWEDRFESNSLTAILAEHVWEHLSFEQGLKAAKICYQYLKPNGYIRCAVPDGYFKDETYQNIVKVGGPGPNDHPASSHKIVYNYNTLTSLFKKAGFDVNLLEYCDADGIFHSNEWDGKNGVIFRSKKYDPRNKEVLVFPSLIVDAIKR